MLKIHGWGLVRECLCHYACARFMFLVLAKRKADSGEEIEVDIFNSSLSSFPVLPQIIIITTNKVFTAFQSAHHFQEDNGIIEKERSTFMST